MYSHRAINSFVAMCTGDPSDRRSERVARRWSGMGCVVVVKEIAELTVAEGLRRGVRIL